MNEFKKGLMIGIGVLVLLVVLCGVFFGGAAWGGSKHQPELAALERELDDLKVTHQQELGDQDRECRDKIEQLKDEQSRQEDINFREKTAGLVDIHQKEIDSIEDIYQQKLDALEDEIDDLKDAQRDQSYWPGQPSYYPSPSYWSRYSSGEFHASVYEKSSVKDWYRGWFKDDCINYHWGSDGPPDFDLERFSIKWEGEISIKESGDYRFMIDSDDDARLYVNGRRVYDNKTIYLSRGQHQIKLKYTHDNGGDAYVSLWWQRTS